MVAAIVYAVAGDEDGPRAFCERLSSIRRTIDRGSGVDVDSPEAVGFLKKMVSRFHALGAVAPHEIAHEISATEIFYRRYVRALQEDSLDSFVASGDWAEGRAAQIEVTDYAERRCDVDIDPFG